MRTQQIFWPNANRIERALCVDLLPPVLEAAGLEQDPTVLHILDNAEHWDQLTLWDQSQTIKDYIELLDRSKYEQMDAVQALGETLVEEPSVRTVLLLQARQVCQDF